MQFKKFMEELKGKQHKLDKNKNGKLDAHDFKLLRKEEQELVSEGAYEKAEENKRSADAAKKQGDMFAHHLHMADHHDNMAEWHDSKGRHNVADSHMKKSEEHHAQAMKLKEEVQIDEVSDATKANYIKAARKSVQALDKSGKEEKRDQRSITANRVYSGMSDKAKKMANEEVELDEADVQARADYKLDKAGRKYHKQIAFKDGSNDEANEKNEVREATQFGLPAHSKSHVEKKIKAGDWEATHDIKTGRHLEIIDHSKGGKRKTIHVKEELDMNEEMTDAQKAERERLVKGMKKNIAGFKAKYGERAKEVMYATATKQAMKEETLKEESGQHKVMVTVSDPNHPAVSQRKEQIMKRVIVKADNKDHAVVKAKDFYKKKGYKVHDAEYHSPQPKSTMKTEELQLEEGFVVKYHDAKGVHKNTSRVFNDKAKADAHASKGNSIDKVGGKYSVHKIDAEGRDVKESVELEEAVESGNKGYGYHGQHDSDVADKAYSKAHATVKKVAGEAGHLKDAKKPNVMVKHYLDSRHGRHLAGLEHDHEYIKKDFGKFKKSYKESDFAKEGLDFDEEGTLMSEKKTYAQFMEQLLEYTPGPGGVTRVQGRSYGAQYHDPEGDDDADDKPKKAAEPAVKRGRGRPAGSKSGANQKVTSGKSYGGIATHSLHLPSSNR